MHLALDLQHWYNMNNMQWKKTNRPLTKVLYYVFTI